MIRSRWLTVLFLSLFLAGCGLLGGTEKKIQQAETALARGDYGEAVVTLQNLLDSEPERADVRLLLARALYQQNDAASAERMLQTAVEKGADAKAVADLRAQWMLLAGEFQALLDATHDKASPYEERQRTYYRARALQGLRRMPEALALYQALAVQQDSPDLQLRIAQCHAYHGHLAQAQAALDRALSMPAAAEHKPVSAEVWLLKMVLAQRDGDVQATRAALAKAIDAAPGQLGAMQQARLLVSAIDEALRQADMAEATRLHAALVKLLPQSPLTSLVGAQLRLFSGKAAEAIGDLQQQVQKQPENSPARELLVAGQLRVGAVEQALQAANALVVAAPEAKESKRVQQLIRSASEQAPESAERSLAVVAALAALQQPALARLRLQEALEKHTDSVPLKVAYVQLELRNGHPAEALQRAQALAIAHPEVSGVQALVAEAQVAGGDLRAAAATYEGLWKSRPSSQLAIALAQIRRRAGLPDPEQTLRQWLATHPRDASIRLNLAIALQQSGQMTLATQEFQRVVADVSEGQPLQAIARNNLAVLYSLQADPRALETARLAYEGAKDAPAIQDTYGWLLAQQGKTRQALPLLKSAAEASPMSAEIRYHYAVALAKEGSRDEARMLLTDVLLADGSFIGKSEAEKLLAAL